MTGAEDATRPPFMEMTPSMKEMVEAFASDPAPVAEPLPEKPKITLEALLATMQLFDEGMAIDFDPAQVVGDLKDKVDAVKSVIDRMEFQAEWARQKADPFMKAAYSLEKKVERLKEYVRYSMEKNGFQELPGNTFRAQLQKNAPSLEVTQPECSAIDYSKWPNYCKQIRYYEWDKAAIKSALLDKAELPFAKLHVGTHVRFYINPPAEGAKQKRLKK
jgi:hypothetical protein